MAVEIGVFHAWPKIPRLKDSTVVITEKIDGTNAAVVIQVVDALTAEAYDGDNVLFIEHYEETMTPTYYAVWAQSRTRIITPTNDNFGFAAWAWKNAPDLVKVLGVGHHYGEWWGSGIQRGYGLEKGEKRFSLFNSGRWEQGEFDYLGIGLSVVPVILIGQGSKINSLVDNASDYLKEFGSRAAPGFMKPEGLVLYHVAAKQNFKVLFEGEGKPKGLQ